MIQKLRARLAELRLETRAADMDTVNEAGLTRRQEIADLEGRIAAYERLAKLAETQVPI
jgi:hypothetical protein